MKHCLRPHNRLRMFAEKIHVALLCLALFCLLGTPAHAESKGEINLAHPYAIQLKLSSKPHSAADLPELPQLAPYRVYVSTRTADGKTWHRLRVGFFPTAQAAAALNASLQEAFPGAWVTRVSAKERQTSNKKMLVQETKSSLLGSLFGKGKKAPSTAPIATPAPAPVAPVSVDTVGVTTAKPASINLDHRYAIELRQTDGPSSLKNLPKLAEFAGRRLYETRVVRHREQVYALRLGFFKTAKQAKAVKKALASHFPDAWVTKTAKFERKESAKYALDQKPTPSVKKASPKASKGLREPAVTTPIPAIAPPLVVAPLVATLPTAPSLPAKAAKPSTKKPQATTQKAVTDTTTVKKKATKTLPVKNRVDLSNAYTLQLMLSAKPIDPKRLPALPAALRGYRLYVVKTTLKDKPRFVLRLGFFATSREASQYQSALEPLFKGNWVTRVSEAERKDSFSTRIVQDASTAISRPAVKKAIQALSPAQKEKLQLLMIEGRGAITRRDYNRAIQVFTKMLAMPPHPLQADAREFLGLARERNGQFAHAKSEYQSYLTHYPDGDGAVRVRQRLSGLMTAAKTPSERLRATKTRDKAATWRVTGGVSQYYRYDVDVDQTGNTNVLESSLSTNLDLNLRRRGGNLNLRSRFSGDYRYDLLNEDSVNRGRITTMYVDASHRSNPWSGRIGRMTQTSGGVLGRYDGLTLGHRLAPKVQVNLVAGFPVDFSTVEQINTDKKFVGLNTDLGTLAEAWDINLFIVQQTVTGVVDRRATGAEIRYFKVNRSLFALLDYDLMFGQLNTALLLGNLTLPDKSTLNLMVDVRKSPVLTTTNALQGQPVFSLETLTTLIDDKTARELAEARTATSRTVTLGGTHPFNERVQVNMDFTLSQLGGTDGSDPVPGIPGSVAIAPINGTGQEYFFNTQVIINRLLRDNDVSIIGVRYSNTSAASTTSLSLNTRYPAGKHWRVNPRLRADFRNNDTDSSKNISVYPSLRLDYRIGRVARLEIQAGGDWTSHSFAGNNEYTHGYYASLGYRLSF